MHTHACRWTHSTCPFLTLACAGMNFWPAAATCTVIAVGHMVAFSTSSYVLSASLGTFAVYLGGVLAAVLGLASIYDKQRRLSWLHAHCYASAAQQKAEAQKRHFKQLQQAKADAHHSVLRTLSHDLKGAVLCDCPHPSTPHTPVPSETRLGRGGHQRRARGFARS